MRTSLLLAGLLAACAASAGPTVPKAELAAVPEAWQSTWAPHQEAWDAARGEAQAAETALAEARAAHRQAEQELEAREAAAKAARKAMKQASKDGDLQAAREAAEVRTQADAALLKAERAEAEAEGQADLAEATHDLAQARAALARAKLEQVKAQAVADAGGWVEVNRYDEAVLGADKDVDKAEAALEKARARAVLAGQ